ncbi:uncharacterized protein BDW70DRAFT_160777 [Aspergillus foveolatus]|uniref:uncharacterized protein n=1 Tax=Aspergillus foveolatus TaxID=210207 RepID=UPI003CCCCAB8
MTLLFLHLFALLGEVAYAASSSSSVSVSRSSISLPPIYMPCSELEAFNANLGPLLNLTQYIPSGTSSSLLPQLEPRLAAIESFTAGYSDLVNAFSTSNCAATRDTIVPSTRLRTRQLDILGVVCQILGLVQEALALVSEPVAGLIQDIEDALGCPSDGQKPGGGGAYHLYCFTSLTVLFVGIWRYELNISTYSGFATDQAIADLAFVNCLNCITLFLYARILTKSVLDLH